MASLFFKVVVDPSNNSMDLPERYKDLHLKDAFPVGRVVLTIDEVSSWNARVTTSDDVYSLTNGWQNFVKDNGIGFLDLLAFQLVTAQTFKITHIKFDQSVSTTNFCYHVYLSPDKTDLSLPTAYVNHHFNGQAPDHPIIIDFNNKHRWIVEIKNLSRADYITDGWTVIKKDLKLLPGAFIVFEKVKQYVLNTMVFKPNGMQVVDELKESGGNEDSQLQQHQAKNKPDVEISWILTDRFRFPISFTEEAGFGKLKEIDVKTERELFTKMPLHCEPSNNKNRYAIKGWAKFMTTGGIVNGCNYRLKFVIKDSLLVVSRL